MLRKFLNVLLLVLAVPFLGITQETNSALTGTVKDAAGKALVGATITATHQPTGTVYTAISRAEGRYDINNMRPGGPYTIATTFVGFVADTRADYFLSLGDRARLDFALATTEGNLTEVVVAARRTTLQARGGVETNIGRDKIASLPTVGRNLSDFLRFVPQAKVTNDGGISIAGQNNRFNSFYIDGAVNNDVFGLAASGTNGGQAGIPPISIDAIDQFSVVLSPYDPSLGNFTGGGINAITRSGTNNLQGSIYHFFRNESLTGKTPGVAKDKRVKLSDFSNKTTGFRVGGAIIKNKLFFFLNGEMQRDVRPQPFNFSDYKGSLTQADLTTLTNFLKNNYKYDAGGYLDNAESVNADRLVGKIDWNINPMHKLSASYRFTSAERYNTSRSSDQTINFYNNGYIMPNVTNSGSIELNSRFKGNANNRLLLTFTRVTDDRNPIGDPFPRVRIRDGASSLFFGTEEFSTANKLNQNNYAIFDVFRFYRGKHSFSVGTDNELSNSYNVFIRQNFGSYDFPDLATFLNGGNATTYNRSYSLLDKSTGDESENAAAKFNTLRLAFFLNDEIRVNDKLTLNLGIRADRTVFLTTPKEDKFFNDTALAKISQYYDLQGARSGQISDAAWSLNPRIGFTYRMPEENASIRGGVGLFTGRVPLVWPGGVYNNNGISIAGINRSNVAFRSDPFNQYVASDFGATAASPSGEVNLIAKDFRLNKVFRASLAIDKNLGSGWRTSLEGVYTKNINEIQYTKVDNLPPSLRTAGADVRNVYELSGSFPRQIPLRANGTNPYTGIFLLSNNEGDKGFSYNFTASLDKTFNQGFSVSANYNYGNSVVLNEGTSSQNLSQWRFMEAVNGRNFLPLSTSDFDVAHRLFVYGSKKFTYANRKASTTISLVYNGQSGQPFSYVMTRGLVRDYDNSEDNDLIYVPRNQGEIVFVQNGNLSPADQWALFNAYIENDKYLSQRRGQYAERNGARAPFSHVVDLKLQQDFNVRIAGRTYQLQLTYDIFNFTNMLNNDWGKQYFISNDNFRLLQFDSFVSSSNLTPRYRFSPVTNPWVLADGVFNSARWTSQLGVRLNF